MKLETSVGRSPIAKNKKEDVLAVQKLLNSMVIDQLCYVGVPASLEYAATLFTADAIPPMGQLRESGRIDDPTVAAIVWFQRNIIKMKSPDGVIGASGATLQGLSQPNLKGKMSQVITDLMTLPSVGAGKKLQEQDFKDTAADLGVGVAEVKAVQSVESAGSGFIEDGRPVIRFEAHVFSRRTKHFFDAVYPNISVRKRNDSLVQGGAAGRKREYDRLQKAMMLDRAAALESTSWGLFQIMGFNYAAVNLRSAEELVAAMYESEGEQLKLFGEFVKKKGLTDFLKNKDWAGFARHYNGSEYGDYDKKMERAYKRYI
jgi:N-acetylmuramidase